VFNKNIPPMEPASRRDLPEGPQYVYQVKWDGVRMLAFILEGQVRLQNRRLRDRTMQYPELSRLPSLVDSSQVVLDGEMTVLKEGKPSFPSILERDLTLKENKISLLKEKLPVTYFVFDILYLEDKSLMDYTFERRQEILREVAKEKSFLKITDNFLDGSRLLDRVKEQDLEGVVAKDKRGAYISGKKSRNWWKIKVKKRQLCTIGGFTAKNRSLSSLLVGAYSQQGLLYLGRAGTGLKDKEWLALYEFLKERVTHKPFFINPPSQSIKPLWTMPSLALWVEYTEWTPDLKLRAPSIKGFTTGEPDECTL